jgi:hypothetical protein
MEIYAYEEQIEEAGDNIENLFLQWQKTILIL